MIHKRRTFSARLQLSYKKATKSSGKTEVPEKQHFPFKVGDTDQALY